MPLTLTETTLTLTGPMNPISVISVNDEHADFTSWNGEMSSVSGTLEVNYIDNSPQNPERMLKLDVKNSAVNDQYTLKIINRTNGQAKNYGVTLVDGKATVNVGSDYSAGTSVRGVLMSNSFSRGILVSGVIE